jgi:hypothetical protein
LLVYHKEDMQQPLHHNHICIWHMLVRADVKLICKAPLIKDDHGKLKIKKMFLQCNM